MKAAGETMPEGHRVIPSISRAARSWRRAFYTAFTTEPRLPN